MNYHNELPIGARRNRCFPRGLTLNKSHIVRVLTVQLQLGIAVLPEHLFQNATPRHYFSSIVWSVAIPRMIAGTVAAASIRVQSCVVNVLSVEGTEP